MPGGEQRVLEMLESESRKSLNKPLLEEDDEPRQHKRSFIDFFRRPNMLGEDLLTIEKFGLVQYVSYGKSLLLYFYLLNSNIFISSDDLKDLLRFLSTCIGDLWCIW